MQRRAAGFLLFVTTLACSSLALATCGDGLLDPGEDCDDANVVAGDCCSPTCTFEPAASPCPDDGNPCSLDQCDAAGVCTHPTGGTAPCDDGDACTIDDKCGDGVCAGTPVPDQCVDPSLCYRARTTVPFSRDFVGFEDQSFFFQTNVRRPRALCLPARTGGGSLVGPDIPLTHVELRFATSPFSVLTWHVTDQFGTLDVMVHAGDRLVFPTATSSSGPPGGPPAPGATNEYACRRVRPAPGASFPPLLTVTATDDLGGRQLLLLRPKRLCAPADINVAGTGIVHPRAYLMCYQARDLDTPHGAPTLTLQTANLLGTGGLAVSSPEELCVPATAEPPPSPCLTSGDECGLPCCRVFPTQHPDCTFSPSVPNPRYRGCTGPTILVDRTHTNFHGVTPESVFHPGRYWGFAKLLVRDGYVVRDSTVPFAELLPTTTAKIIVIANPVALLGKDAISADDVAALVAWVQAGGSLLLSIDHPPFQKVPMLAEALGLTGIIGSAKQHTFTRANGDLNGGSVIANGTGPDTVIDEVTTFTGTGFSISPTPPPFASYEAVLTYPPDSRRTEVGKLQGVAIQFGAGRVYVSGESGCLTAQNAFGMQFTPDNKQYVLNIIHWLDY
jgi:cysteine-rich repeat protein